MQLRQLAGLELKNTIRLHGSQTNVAVLNYVRESIVGVLADADRRGRMIAAQIITTLLHTVTLACWPSLVPSLLSMLDAGGTAADGSLQVLSPLVILAWRRTPLTSSRASPRAGIHLDMRRSQ